MGTHAARTLLAGTGRGAVRARSRGSGPTSTTARSSWPGGPAPDDDVEVVSGSVDERRFVAFYGRGGRLVGRARDEPARPGHALAGARRGGDELRGRGADRGGPAVGCRAVTGGAFLLLALALVAAVGDWIAVHQQTKALEYVCKPLTMVLLDRRGPRPRPRRPHRAGVVRRRARCCAWSATSSSCSRRTSSCSGSARSCSATSPTSSACTSEGVDGPRFLVGIVIVMALLAVIGTPHPQGGAGGP